jgi:hypothetical protein
MHVDTRLEQGVHELRRREKVRLVGGDDVAAGIALLGLPELREEFGGGGAGLEREGPGKPVRVGVRLLGAGARHRLLHAIDSARVDGPAVLAPLFDRVPAHAPGVQEDRLAVA